MDFENMDEPKGAAAKEPKLSDADKASIQKAMDILKPIADREGCPVADLLEDVADPSESSEDDAPEDDGSKVNMIVARLKAKQSEE